MNYRQALLAASLVLGLAGCASYSSGYQSDVVYRDGNYYSPAGEGYGDYYYAPEARDPYYDYYRQDFFYGGGYCSARYSYCPPFGYNRFLAPPFGFIISSGDNGWYDPWGGGFGSGFYSSSPYYYNGRRHGGHDRDRDGERNHRRDQRSWGRDGATPAMPPGVEAPLRRRYPAPAPRPADGRSERRGLAPDARRADPAPQTFRRQPSDADSAVGEEQRSVRPRAWSE